MKIKRGENETRAMMEEAANARSTRGGGRAEEEDDGNAQRIVVLKIATRMRL